MGYQQSPTNQNYYVVRQLSKVIVVKHWKCMSNLKGIYQIKRNQICTIQNYVGNKNRMVCIHKVN